MAAETLYREGRLSVSAIGEKLHISKSTLYSYLRHRGVEIGAYQKSARSRDQQPSAASPAEPPAAERVATVTLRLAVVNNSKFVRGRKRATENIERYCLEGTVAKLAMRQPFVLFKGLTFQKLCLPGAFRPGDHQN
ncbi:helix-turn-helix domain-containing protein, partial [Escherichia coli]|nr:helix-turn-helix domain-containing protein [Escherichia coli]